MERVAIYMKKHPEAKVVIKGYASPEGNLAFNEKLAKARAQAVKSILVKNTRLNDTRITAEGQGIGDMFSLNRTGTVSAFVLSKKANNLLP